MVIGLCTVEIRLPGASSLKAKRGILKGILEKTKKRYNVAVAEVDNQDSWRRATVALVTVSNDGVHIEQTLNRVVGFLDGFELMELIDWQLELF